MGSSRVGDSVTGEVVYFCFGEVKPKQDKGLRKRGTLGLRGFAEAQKPLKRASDGQARAFSRIECVSAKYEADEADIRWNAKVKLKSHTAYEGWLSGEAICTVQVPHSNTPPDKQTT